MGKQYTRPLGDFEELNDLEERIRRMKLLEHSRYTFRNTEVSHFIWNHPFLVELLEDAFPKIHSLFGESQLDLEVIDDPAFPDSAHLTLFVCTNLEVGEALERLDQLKKNWWYKVIPTLQPVERGLLNLNLEFPSNEF